MNLSELTPSDLVSFLKRRVFEERKATSAVIAHLEGMDRRKLRLDLGFSNLYDYRTRELGMSEGSAHQRISALRKPKPPPVEVTKCVGITEAKAASRTIPATTRRAVLERDRGCRECGTRFQLEIDHVQSRSHGGTHDLEDLQVLYAAHPPLKTHRETPEYARRAG
jgi:hypothetical protein